MIRKIFVKGGGGLGDLIREYFGGQDYWGYLKGIKDKYPDIKIKAVLCIHNPQATEFLKYNPYLEKIEQYPWQVDGEPVFNKYKEDYAFIRDAEGIFNELIYEKPSIYLNKEEEEFVKHIQEMGNYVFIHPFAGLKDRVALPIGEYPDLINRIIDDLGYNVVIQGGSYKRTNQGGSEEIQEIFEYQRKGLFNLVGKTNARIAVRLVQNASGFIGTHSCYVLIAWIEKIRSVLVVPEKLREYLHSGDANVWAVREGLDFNKTIYINGRPDIDKIKEEIIEWMAKDR